MRNLLFPFFTCLLYIGSGFSLELFDPSSQIAETDQTSVAEPIYRNNLKNRNFDKEAPQNSDSERASIAEWQDASEDQNYEEKPTTPKTDSSSCFGINTECSPQGSKISAEFLYCRSQNNGFIYAVENFGVSYVNANLQRVDNPWNPGCRVAIGENTSYDQWDVEAVWTHFNNKAHRSSFFTGADAATNTGLISVFSGQQPYEYASGTRKLNFNTIDIDLGKMVDFSEGLASRFFGGIRAGWIHQQFLVKYKNPTAPGQMDTNFSEREKQVGIGLLLGTDLFYRIGLGFEIIGNASTSILYSKTETSQSGEELVNGSFQPNIAFSDSTYNLQPAIRIALGLGWRYCFNNSNTALKISAGWENNYWWDQYHIFTVSSLGSPPVFNNNPLSLEGGYFRLSGDF